MHASESASEPESKSSSSRVQVRVRVREFESESECECSGPMPRDPGVAARSPAVVLLLGGQRGEHSAQHTGQHARQPVQIVHAARVLYAAVLGQRRLRARHGVSTEAAMYVGYTASVQRRLCM